MPETSNPSPPSPTPAPAAKPEVEPKTEKLREISLPAAVLALDLDATGGVAFAACQDGAIHRVDLESGEST